MNQKLKLFKYFKMNIIIKRKKYILDIKKDQNIIKLFTLNK